MYKFKISTCTHFSSRTNGIQDHVSKRICSDNDIKVQTTQTPEKVKSPIDAEPPKVEELKSKLKSNSSSDPRPFGNYIHHSFAYIVNFFL